MSDSEFVLQSYIEEWARLLIGNICHNAEMEKSALRMKCTQIEATKECKNSRLPVMDGFNLYSKTEREYLEREIEALQSIISEFFQHPLFPKLFVHMIITTHTAFSLFITEDQHEKKPKGLHKTDVTVEEHLTSLEKFECSVFIFLSKIYARAAVHPKTKTEEIPVVVIQNIFKFMNSNEPNSVRRSAGEILSAMSSSPQHCQSICDIFWKQYGACKKDIDIRNFATWVDGIVNIQFSFKTVEMSELSLQFLRTFVATAKKIDRGVLRMKFLDVLLGIITKLSGGISGYSREDYRKVVTDIWNAVTKWAKGEHTVFCNSFLCKVLAAAPFLYDEYGRKFAEKLSDLARKGDLQILGLLPLFFSSIPTCVTEEKLTDLFFKVFLPNIVGSNEKKRCLRFTEQQQVDIVVQFFTEVGNRSPGIFVTFASGVFAVEKPSDDHKIVRFVTLRALNQMSKFQNPTTKSDELFTYIFQMVATRTIESPLALNLFPAIRSPDTAKNAEFLDCAFGMSDTTEGVDAVCRFIERCAKLGEFFDVSVRLMEKSINNVPYLTRMIENLSTALRNETSGSFETIFERSILSSDHWISFRTAIDASLLEGAIQNEEEALKCLLAFGSDTIHKIDMGAKKNENSTTLSQLIDQQGAKSDIIPKARQIVKLDPTYASNLLIEIHKQGIANHTPKYLQFACTLAFDTTQTNGDFVMSLLPFVIANSSLAIAFSSLPSCYWSLVATTETEISLHDNWPQYCLVLYYISTQQKFQKVIEDNGDLAKAYSLHLRHWAKKKQDPTCDEKAFNILNAFARAGDSALSYLHQKNFDKFLKSLTKKSIDAPETLLIAMLDALIELLSRTAIEDITVFSTLSQWISDLSVQNENTEVIQRRVVSLLTAVISYDPRMLRQAFRASLSSKTPASSNYILAIGNVLIDDEFTTKYSDGRSVVLASIISHINNNCSLCRQASLKLVCISGQKHFYSGDCREANIPISSQSASGYVMQAQKFISYVSEAASTDDCKGAILLLAEDFAFLEEQQEQVIPNVAFLIRRIAKESDTLNQLLNLTSRVRSSDPSIASAIHRLWSDYFEVAHNHHLPSQVFEYGCSYLPKAPEMITAAKVLADVFIVMPKEVASVLISELCQYYRHAPQNADTFKEYIQHPEVKFSVSNREILASCALSQILIELNSQAAFEQLILPFLAPLTFFAIMQYHIDDLDVPGFHPLLDSILDASLFRLGDISSFSENLQILQKANLIRRAASLVPQYSVELETPVKQVLCYDHMAVFSIADLMCQVDENFFEDLYQIVFANAVKAESSSRSMEPILMLMALCKQLTTRAVHLLLIFTLNALITNRDELLDPLVDVLHGRLLSSTIPLDNFQIESLPILCTFILMLGIDLKQSFHVNVSKAIADVISKMAKVGAFEVVSPAFVEFINSFNGDEYIASLFLKFIENAPSFLDEGVTVATRALLCLSRLITESEEPGFCYLFGTMIDATRVFLGNAVQHEIDPIDGEYDTVDGLISMLINQKSLSDHDHIMFMINFAQALATTFATKDQNAVCLGLQYISSIIRLASPHIEAEKQNELAKVLLLLPMTTEDKVQEFASIALNSLISQINDCPIATASFDIATILPRFVEDFRKPIGSWKKTPITCIDRKQFPTVTLFQRSKSETPQIIDRLSQLLTNRVPHVEEKPAVPLAMLSRKVISQNKSESSSSEEDQEISESLENIGHQIAHDPVTQENLDKEEEESDEEEDLLPPPMEFSDDEEEDKSQSHPDTESIGSLIAKQEPPKTFVIPNKEEEEYGTIDQDDSSDLVLPEDSEDEIFTN